MEELVDPYSKRRFFDHCSCLNAFSREGYFDRYRNMKILQIQCSGDEFFLPDNEVNQSSE